MDKENWERRAGKAGARIMHTVDGHEVICFRPDDLEKFTSQPPPILFDVFAVLQALDENAKGRTSVENVNDVLNAVVSLMRSNTN